MASIDVGAAGSLLDALLKCTSNMAQTEFQHDPKRIIAVRKATELEKGLIEKSVAKCDTKRLGLLHFLPTDNKENEPSSLSNAAANADAEEEKSLEVIKGEIDAVFSKMAAVQTSLGDFNMQSYLDLRARFAGLWAACCSLQKQKSECEEADAEEKKRRSLKNKRDAARASLQATQANLKKIKQDNDVLREKSEQLKKEVGQCGEQAQAGEGMEVNEAGADPEEMAEELRREIRRKEYELEEVQAVSRGLVAEQAETEAEGAEGERGAGMEVEGAGLEEVVTAEQQCKQLTVRLEELEQQKQQAIEGDTETKALCDKLAAAETELATLNGQLEQVSQDNQSLRALTRKVVDFVAAEQEGVAVGTRFPGSEKVAADPHVLAMIRCLKSLQSHSGEMLLDDLKKDKDVGFKAIYALVANSLVKIDRSCIPNTVLSLID